MIFGTVHQPRYIIPNVSQHAITRGVDRRAVFFKEDDYQLYVKVLQDATINSQHQVHACVLMINHVHMLVTAERKHSQPSVIQAMGRTCAQQLNVRYQCTGTFGSVLAAINGVQWGQI